MKIKFKKKKKTFPFDSAWLKTKVSIIKNEQQKTAFFEIFFKKADNSVQ